MRRLAAPLLALLLVASLGACGGFATGEEAGRASPTSSAATASRLPDATLQPLRSTDRPVALGDLRGPMVVNLWAQWCGPCKDELPYYQRFHEQHPKVAMLGIDWQDTQPTRAIALARESGLTYPLVRDPQRVIAGRGLPQLLLIDAQGRIAYREYVEITSTAQLEDLVRTHLGVDL